MVVKRNQRELWRAIALLCRLSSLPRGDDDRLGSTFGAKGARL